tara:strand:+ start:2499 stop:3332 length:834 start_codon:yes stop_codon:yes gene_type:complete
MNKNTFSFLLSIYKNDKYIYLKECLDSIINQTIKADEIIIVQEGDVDKDINELISFYKKIYPISHYKLPFQNGPLGYGLPNCLNYGIKKAKSKYIVRIDSDDINESNRLEIIDDYIKNNSNVKLFGSYVREYDENMIKPGKIRSVPLYMNKIISYCKFRNPFNGPSVVFEKDTAISLGGYPNIPSNEDWCFWVNFILNDHDLGNIPLVLVNMRGGDGIIERRSSKRYSKGEVMSIKYIYNKGFFSMPIYYFNLVSRYIIRLFPSEIIKFIYNNYLRK